MTGRKQTNEIIPGAAKSDLSILLLTHQRRQQPSVHSLYFVIIGEYLELRVFNPMVFAACRLMWKSELILRMLLTTAASLVRRRSQYAAPDLAMHLTYYKIGSATGKWQRTAANDLKSMTEVVASKTT